MNISALEVLLAGRAIGLIFLFGDWQAGGQVRFVAHDAFADDEAARTLSLSFEPASADQRRAMWRLRTDLRFTGQPDSQGRSRLPCFFQNMLPEGIFARHVAQQAHKEVDDHFHLIAACGGDLPGAVALRPYVLDQQGIERLIGNHQEPVTYTVTDDPVEGVLSLSGVQPKLGLIRDGDRFVGRTTAQGRHVIAKLPVVSYPGMPQLEYLSLQMAGAAGVKICTASLQPIALLADEHRYDLGVEANGGRFLCVERFDRDGGPTRNERIHCEDFAQILDRYPTQKYQASYAEVAAVMLGEPTLGEEAVYELMRRMLVNELIGNTDMHLKNISVIYPDGHSPVLAPAYDIVAYCVHYPRRGHALPLYPDMLNPLGTPLRVTANANNTLPDAYPGLGFDNIDEWADVLALSRPRCKRILRDVIKIARERWPVMIEQSEITAQQKQVLAAYVAGHPLLQ